MPLEKETKYQKFCHSYNICVIYLNPPSIMQGIQRSISYVITML
jgi:hypothetical protein